MDLWNNLGFSLYIVSPVCYIVAISEVRKKSKIEWVLIGMLLLNTRDQV